MKKSDTEQEQPGLEENKVPDSQSKRELDRELQELAEKESSLIFGGRLGQYQYYDMDKVIASALHCAQTSVK